MEVPKSIIIQYLYQYAGYPEFHSSSNTYNACCPVCKEGKSWGKKKRLYFMPNKNNLYCHNCQLSWSPFEWICDVSGKTHFELMQEISDSGECFEMFNDTSNVANQFKYPTPFSSINLFNETEMHYYAKNKIVRDATKVIKQRRLDTALNKVELFISLKDFVYKNRICFPFKNTSGEVIFFQCRSIYKNDAEGGKKYISKYGADKSVFNIDKVDINYPYIFLFEGPIDSMFVKNGVAVAGLSFTELQEKQLSTFLTHEKIWVLDNQRKDEDAMKKSLSLVRQGETVFVWPKKFQKFKDVNDVCVALGKDSLPPEFFIKHSVNNETSFMSESL